MIQYLCRKGVIPLTLGERIKKARRSLDLTQQKFADQIGTTQNNIASYEIGRREPSAAAINNICKTFNVNETWLRTGEGEMFLPKADTALDRLAAEHNLTSADYLFVEKFLGLKPDSRKIIIDYIREVAAAITDGEAASISVPLDTGQQEAKAPLELKPVAEMTHAEIDRFSEQLRQELHREKAAAAKSPAFPGSGTNGNVPPTAAGSSGAGSATG